MGFLDRLFGREEPRNRGWDDSRQAPARSEDEIAVERYRYLLRTAPPETIEQVHEEAFTKLTDEQRDLLFQQLTQNAPAGEQPRGRDPHSLAQSATRSEFRQPGTMERAMAPTGPGGPSFGSMFGGSLLGTVAGMVIGSALVSAFLPDPGLDQAGGDAGGDAGAADASADGGGDAGGDFGGGGGDFGGGDFGGGDFGGF